MATKHNEVVLLETRLNENHAKVMPSASMDEFFQLDAIDTVLRQRDLTHQEIEDGVVDGSDDGGVDAAFVFVNGDLISDLSAIRPSDGASIHLHVLQVKNESGFSETALQKLIDSLPQLCALGAVDEKLLMEFNPKVVERFGLFRQTFLAHSSFIPDLSITVSYVSKSVAPANSKVLAKANRLRQAMLREFSSAAVEIGFIGARELNVFFRSRKKKTTELRFSEQPISADLGGVVALVRLVDYFQFITDETGKIRESIFEENVRGYEGETNINRGIAHTLGSSDSGVDFWWLNNGITVLGTRMNLAGKLAAIEDPQIVNGLQTSRAIFNYFSKFPDVAKIDDGNRHLLVRVIEAADDRVAAEIIKATNSQNRVPTASLRAAEPFQRSIEEYLLGRGRYYERRRNHYKNKGVKRSHIVSVLELAQAVASISHALPADARGRPSALVRDPLYARIFSEKAPLEFYWRAIEIMETIDAFLREEKNSGRQERSNLRFHLARVVTAAALSSSRPQPKAVVKVDASVLRLHLESAYAWTLAERQKFGQEVKSEDWGTIAKSKEFNDRINARLGRYSAKQNWPKSLHSGWAK